MGRIHLSHLAGFADRVAIVAVADDRSGVLDEVNACYGIAGYKDFQEMLEREKPEALVIATPPASHPALIAEAAARHAHIFCEKPLALTLDEAHRTAEAVNTNGVLFQIGFQRRFDRAYLRAAQKIQAGLIGDLITFKAVARDAWEPNLEYARIEVSGGLLLDMAIHDFDLARWMMGSEVRRVSTEGNNMLFPQLSKAGDIDNAVVNLTFDSGAIGNIEASRTGTYGYDIRTEIVGTRGALFIGPIEDSSHVVAGRDGFRREAIRDFEARFLDSYRLEMSEFIDCVAEGRAPECGLREGILSLQIALAARESLLSRSPVEIPR
jgi:predicted dehydrogenase